MDTGLGREIIRAITGVGQCEVLVSGERTSYLKPKSEAYLVRMRDIVRNDICLVDDLEHIREDYVKISVYDPAGIQNSQDFFLMNLPDVHRHACRESSGLITRHKGLIRAAL